MSGPCRSAVSRAVMSVLQFVMKVRGSRQYSNQGLLPLRRERQFAWLSELRIKSAESTGPEIQGHRRAVSGGRPAEPRNRFPPNEPGNLRLTARAGTPEARFHRGTGGGKGTGK